ncbi:MAG: C39 family peptidase [Proteobacteria bacterium]|nr:C39 family peptidase [Pseudomonadota bacterium]MBU4472454.1 C39 family peptidase [Pseudomonadota bacterium]MCG2751281.1 cysteine peptidase family C39 domain-containing protein [Desulfobacteraceae bacterium]
MKAFLVALLCLAFAASPGAEEIEGIPFFRQERHQCGQAALASVLAYYKIPVDMELLIGETYSQALKGSLMADLENYAKGLGFKTKSGQGTLQTLKESVLARKPVIVLLDHGVWLAARPHYIVIFGFNEKGFIAHDGNEPSILFQYKGFEKTWKKMGHPYLIIHP